MRKELTELAWQCLIAEARFFEKEIMPAYSKAVMDHITDLISQESLKSDEEDER